MHRSYPAITLALITLLLPVSAALAGDAFTSYPGARERALAGAAAAMSGSPASVWHNPALLPQASSSFVGGVYQRPDRDPWHTLQTKTAPYLGASFVNPNKWVGTVATGLYYYEPYRLSYHIDDSGEAGSAHGRVNVRLRTLALPYAIDFADNALSLGATAELVGLKAGGSDLQYRDQDGIAREADIDGSTQTGVSATLGLRYIVSESENYSLRLGGVYRLPSTSGARLDPQPRAVARALPNKPQGYETALALHLPLAAGQTLELGAQYGVSDWRAGGKTRRLGLGLEYQRPFGESLLQPGQWSLRAGSGRFRADPAADWLDWPQGRSISLGTGVAFQGGWTVDLVLERRRESRQSGDQHASFFGLDIGYRY